MAHDVTELTALVDRCSRLEPQLTEVPAGSNWLRLMRTQHLDPLGCGFGSSRFSDPRPGHAPAEGMFRVVYAAADLETAFEEAVLRDRSDGRHPPFALSRSELASYHCSVLTVRRNLRVVELRSSAARRRLGMATDVVRALDHRGGQGWALALHQHPRQPDGILYPSRLSGATNLAIFDRALQSMSGAAPIPLLEFELRPLLRAFGIAVVRSPADARRRGKDLL